MSEHSEESKSQHQDDLGFALPEPAKLSPARAALFALIALLVLSGALALGWLPRHKAATALAEQTQAQGSTLLRVQLLTPKVGQSDRSIALPGSVQPLEETVLYPRASGYVRKWHFDIGDTVKEGDVLAEIDTPEIDQQIVAARAQLAQAEAGVVQAKANHDFSKQNLSRFEQLAPAGVSSQQELDKGKAQAAVDSANVLVAQAKLQAQRAEVQRLVDMKGFARVVAPFAGRVTSRSIERGALVTAGTASPLFKLAANDTMRVFIQVPQDLATSVKVEVPAKVSVREYPGRFFDGKVAHAAGALDSATRTMNTEVRVPNPKGELLAGMYGNVMLSLPVPHRVYEIPATALLNDAKGVRVGVVGPDDKVRLVPVVIERDNGATIEISSGLAGDERVVRVASVDLVEGRSVEIVK
jgi:membrane fusion protein (multidrug efflux system)